MTGGAIILGKWVVWVIWILKINTKFECEVTLSLPTEGTSRKDKPQSWNRKLSSVKNFVLFKNTEAFTLKCNEFILLYSCKANNNNNLGNFKK